MSLLAFESSFKSLLPAYLTPPPHPLPSLLLALIDLILKVNSIMSFVTLIFH